MNTASTDPYRATDVSRKVADIRQLARVEILTAGGGGRRARLFAAGGFDVEVLPDRGLDLGAVTWRGIPIAFCTPALWQSTSQVGGDEGFARRFGAGLLTTCGLDQFGSPNVDAGQRLPQHGRATELAAADLSPDASWTADGYQIGLSGRLHQWRLFGEDLTWHRRISTVLGSNQLVIEDTVTNQGATSWPHMMLYHFNIGYPLLDARSTIDVGGQSSTPQPRDAAAATGLADWNVFPAPSTTFPEQVFLHTFDPAAAGRIRVHNPALGLAVTITVDPALLPWAFQWRSAAERAYVLGVEPANCPTVDGRSAARAAGVLPHLSPGETKTYRLELTIDMD